MSGEESKFKHNYGLLHLVLKFLIAKGLLICFTKGVISGSTYSNLYIKVVPDQLDNGKIEIFVSQQLSLLWELKNKRIGNDQHVIQNGMK